MFQWLMNLDTTIMVAKTRRFVKKEEEYQIKHYGTPEEKKELAKKKIAKEIAKKAIKKGLTGL